METIAIGRLIEWDPEKKRGKARIGEPPNAKYLKMREFEKHLWAVIYHPENLPGVTCGWFVWPTYSDQDWNDEKNAGWADRFVANDPFIGEDILFVTDEEFCKGTMDTKWFPIPNDYVLGKIKEVIDAFTLCRLVRYQLFYTSGKGLEVSKSYPIMGMERGVDYVNQTVPDVPSEIGYFRVLIEMQKGLGFWRVERSWPES